jgi:hypothetical protein
MGALTAVALLCYTAMVMGLGRQGGAPDRSASRIKGLRAG